MEGKYKHQVAMNLIKERVDVLDLAQQKEIRYQCAHPSIMSHLLMCIGLCLWAIFNPVLQ